MKKVLTYLVMILMTVLVFYGGAGINLISYCCNICRMEGIAAVINDKCCDIHHHDHSKHESTDCCNMERISFDWCSQNSPEQEIDLSPLTLDLFSGNLLTNSHFDILTAGDKHLPASHGPPIALPRDYLSILTVLLI